MSSERAGLFINWLGWCWRFKTIAPWSVRWVSRKPPTEQDIAAAHRFLVENPDIEARVKEIHGIDEKEVRGILRGIGEMKAGLFRPLPEIEAELRGVVTQSRYCSNCHKLIAGEEPLAINPDALCQCRGIQRVR